MSSSNTGWTTGSTSPTFFGRIVPRASSVGNEMVSSDVSAMDEEVIAVSGVDAIESTSASRKDPTDTTESPP